MTEWTIKFTKEYLIFLLLFYFFITRDWLENQISIFGYVDECIALLAVLIWSIKLVSNKFTMSINRGYERYVVVFTLCGIVGNVFYNYQPIIQVALPDLFLCLKFWLAIYTGRYLFRRFDIDAYANQIYFHVRLVTYVFTFLVIADYVMHIFPASIRYGLRSTQLFYSHTTVFAAECVFLFVILMMIHSKVNGWGKYMALICLLICTTLRSKSFAAVMAFMLIFYFIEIRKKKVRLRTLVAFVPLCIMLAWDQIEYYFFSSIQSDSARYQLLINALKIANDHFPMGSGFGTYASYYSGVVYSQLYYMYGISNVNGLIEGASRFISDSFWPAVLGQTGWIGLVAYAVALLILLKNIQKLRTFNISFYIAAMCIFAYEVIVSAAETAFFHPLAIQFALLLGYMLETERIKIKLFNAPF